MHLSKPISAAQAESRVLQYEPQRFDLGIPGVAMNSERKKSSGFQMSDIIRKQTGLKELEKQGQEEEIENRVLSRLKDVQESAYKEAYELGVGDGRKEAFRSASVEIEERLSDLDQLMGNIENIKAELFAQTESHLLQLAFHMAKRLAGHEIGVNPDSIVNILREAVQVAQSEEQVTVKVAPEQLEFLEKLQKEGTKEIEHLKKIKIEADKSVTVGGCIVHTNFGEIDSRFEQRVDRLWEAVSGNLIRVKDTLKSAG